MIKISNLDEAELYISEYDYIKTKDEKLDVKYTHLRACERLAKEAGSDRLLCRTRTYILSLLIEHNEFSEALELAQQNLLFSQERKLEKETLFMLSIIAHLYHLLGNYSASEELMQIAIDSIPLVDNDLKVCKIYLMVADQYFFTDKNKCIQAYETCIDYAHKCNDLQMLSVSYNNYVDSLIKFDMHEKALECIQIGYQYALQYDKPYINALYYGNFGFLYLQTGNYIEAESFLKKSSSYYLSNNQVPDYTFSMINLSRVYLATKKLAPAQKILAELEEQALSSSANNLLVEVYSVFSEYYTLKKDYKAALDYKEKFIRVKDIIYNEDSDKRIRNLQITHDVKTIKTERDAAEKLARIKHDFLANMSHEIRTPINSILGICYLLQQGELTEKQKDYVRRLNYSGENLLGIINDILDISKIEAGKFHLTSKEFSIHALARNIHQLLLQKAEEKGLQFVLTIDQDVPEFCIGDETRTGQVLLNVIGNALKFTKKGFVRFTISAESVFGGNAQLLFKISDSGIGMSETQKSKVFSEYEQAEDDTQSKFGGTGLGLSITTKLVELMNGTIKMDSIENKGTDFYILIPFVLPENSIKQTPATGQDLTSLGTKLIYIADDVEENRRVMSELIHSLNPTVRISEAQNGKELLSMLRNGLPDFIFMDLDMPELNGFDAALEITRSYPGNSVKVIACTASLLSIPRSELTSYGFKDLLQKPFTIHQLSETLLVS